MPSQRKMKQAKTRCPVCNGRDSYSRYRTDGGDGRELVCKACQNVTADESGTTIYIEGPIFDERESRKAGE